MSNDSKKAYHNQGQEDAKRGRYNEPHGFLDDITTWSESGMKTNEEDNEAYKEGWANTKGQIDGAQNRYDPPSKDTKEAYDKAWKSSYAEKSKK